MVLAKHFGSIKSLYELFKKFIYDLLLAVISYAYNIFIFIMPVSYKLLLATISIFILPGKNSRSLWSSCKISRYWTPPSRKNLSLLSSL